MAVIALQDVTYTYPLEPDPALRGMNLTVEPGEFVGVVGPNGAGKSTLCYLLAGFVPHFFRGDLEGSVEVLGIDLRQSSIGEMVARVGLVFQNPFNQISGAKSTVYEEIGFGLENLGIERQEMQSRIERAMEMTETAELANRSPFALSGGQQQRVALASILVMEPEILVLDEPTSQLDPLGTREVFKVVKELARLGSTVIMVEHKLEWVAEFASRVIALAGGEIILDGAPGEVLASPSLSASGGGATRYTSLARKAAEQGLWPSGLRLPVTLAEARAGFEGSADAD